MSEQMRVNLSERAMFVEQKLVDKGEASEKLPGGFPSFGEVLDESMSNVNSLQQVADRETRRLALGDVEDVSQVVMAVSQAELALKLAVEVRNKLVDAYQQLSRMPL